MNKQVIIIKNYHLELIFCDKISYKIQVYRVDGIYFK